MAWHEGCLLQHAGCGDQAADESMAWHGMHAVACFKTSDAAIRMLALATAMHGMHAGCFNTPGVAMRVLTIAMHACSLHEDT